MCPSVTQDDSDSAYALAVGLLQMGVVLLVLSAALGAGIHGVSGELSERVPTADFNYEYDGATGTLSITHDGGDPIDAAALRVSGAGDGAACRGGAWASGRVDAEDTCVLEGVPSDGTVRLVWDGGGPESTVLDVWAATRR